MSKEAIKEAILQKLDKLDRGDGFTIYDVAEELIRDGMMIPDTHYYDNRPTSATVGEAIWELYELGLVRFDPIKRRFYKP